MGIEGLPPYTVGDVTEPESVERALDGCDAVVHAAAVYSLDARMAETVQATNAKGTETVLGTAHRLGLDPIVYVSSYVAFFPPDGHVLTPDSPVKEPPGAYYKSKADAERAARRFQEEGAPIATVYPGGLFGPNDPHFGENAQAVENVLKGRVPFLPKGGPSIVDVRDVAKAIAALMAPGLGPRRYMVSGRNVKFSKVIDTLADLTGRNLRYITLPSWSLWPVVRSAGFLQRFLPFRLPLNTEGFDVLVWDPHGDDSKARRDLGFSPREVRETLRDMVQWMYESGKITAAEAGKMAAAAPR
jgi:nucleoside-diphosphate-sugar epimerase